MTAKRTTGGRGRRNESDTDDAEKRRSSVQREGVSGDIGLSHEGQSNGGLLTL